MGRLFQLWNPHTGNLAITNFRAKTYATKIGPIQDLLVHDTFRVKNHLSTYLSISPKENFWNLLGNMHSYWHYRQKQMNGSRSHLTSEHT